MPEERAGLTSAFIDTARRVTSLSVLMSQAAADRIGINPTDLNCLNIINLDGPMTAGQLAQASGLTTASITGVIDRLERAGFVRRERDPKDRRRVVVRGDVVQMKAKVVPVFQPMLTAWQEMAAEVDDDSLAALLRLQRRMETLLRSELSRMRESPA